jgi:c-di-GMP-binding flagellar brake protein YcgR
MRLVPSVSEPKPLSGIERRQAARLPIDRPAKVARHSSARYEPATTVNVSTTGALLEVRSARPVAVGERMGVAVAWAQEGLIASTQVLPAMVVRADAISADRQRVAVQFLATAEVELAKAA